MNLQQTYQTLLDKHYPYAEKVTTKMLQLFDYCLVFEQPAADGVISRMIANEERLLGRSHEEVITHSELKSLRDAMGASSTEEWQSLILEKQIKPLTKEERMKVFHLEGSTPNQEFYDWIFGNENQGHNKEVK